MMAGRERPRAGSTSVRRGMWVRRGEVRRRACGGRRSPAERAEFFRLPPPEKVARASKTRRRRPDRAQAHRLHRATDCCCNRAAVVSALPAAVDVPRSHSLHSNAEPRGPQIGSVRDQPHTLFTYRSPFTRTCGYHKEVGPCGPEERARCERPGRWRPSFWRPESSLLFWTKHTPRRTNSVSTRARSIKHNSRQYS